MMRQPFMRTLMLILLTTQACTATADGPVAQVAGPSVRAASIAISGFAFAPRALTIPAGTTVTWRNLDEEPHTVRGGDELVRSGALDQGETFSVRFDKPGTYRYGCSIHPQMSGTITVQ